MTIRLFIAACVLAGMSGVAAAQPATSLPSPEDVLRAHRNNCMDRRQQGSASGFRQGWEFCNDIVKRWNDSAEARRIKEQADKDEHDRHAAEEFAKKLPK